MSGVREYSKARVYKPIPCVSSIVQAVVRNNSTVEILINGHPHAGVVTHWCSLLDKHKESCVCVCGHKWQRMGP